MSDRKSPVKVNSAFTEKATVSADDCIVEHVVDGVDTGVEAVFIGSVVEDGWLDDLTPTE